MNINELIHISFYDKFVTWTQYILRGKAIPQSRLEEAFIHNNPPNKIS